MLIKKALRRAVRTFASRSFVAAKPAFDVTKESMLRPSTHTCHSGGNSMKKKLDIWFIQFSYELPIVFPKRSVWCSNFSGYEFSRFLEYLWACLTHITSKGLFFICQTDSKHVVFNKAECFTNGVCHDKLRSMNLAARSCWILWFLANVAGVSAKKFD